MKIKYSSEMFMDRIMKYKIWNILINFQKLIMILTTIVMLGILGAVVFARYTFHVDIFGYDELVLVSTFWMYFIGSSYGLYKESHVKADIIAGMLSDKLRLFLKVVAGVSQTILNVFFNILAMIFIAKAVRDCPVSVAWRLPLIIPQFAILMGFSISTFYLSIYTVRDFIKYLEYKRGG